VICGREKMNEPKQEVDVYNAMNEVARIIRYHLHQNPELTAGRIVSYFQDSNPLPSSPRPYPVEERESETRCCSACWTNYPLNSKGSSVRYICPKCTMVDKGDEAHESNIMPNVFDMREVSGHRDELKKQNKKKFVWRCLICETEIPFDPHGPGNDHEGLLPNLEGGTIEVHFGYGSKFDQLKDMLSHRDYRTQGAICDECFTKRQYLTRKVEVREARRYIVQSEG